MFQWYRCESGIAIFIWRVTWNQAYYSFLTILQFANLTLQLSAENKIKFWGTLSSDLKNNRLLIVAPSVTTFSFYSKKKTITKKVRGFNNTFFWTFKIFQKSKTLENNCLKSWASVNLPCRAGHVRSHTTLRARSVQPFWRLLDTIAQIDRQRNKVCI